MRAYRQAWWNYRVCGVAVTCLCLAASPLEWVRQGNAAYERGDFQQALQHYQNAEALAHDPGLVAFNMAAAHYGLNHFAEAEQCYRRALEDAEGPRRARALYGLGNALARQGNSLHGRGAVQKLLAARKAYQSCLAEESAADELARSTCAVTFADARFNLAVVERLIQQKQMETSDAEEEPGPNPTERKGPERGPPSGTGEPDQKPGAPEKKGPTQPAAGQDRPQPSDQPPPPGKGNLPLLLDDRAAPPLDAESARAHLEAALDRIRKQRAEHTAAPPAATSRVKDW